MKRLRPSAACRWAFCPASLQFETDESNEAALEGTVAHELAAELLNGRPPFSERHGVTVDEAMLKNADLYVQDVLRIARSPQVEQKLGIPDIHENCSGTPDCYIYENRSGDLYIWDFKYGWGLVEAEENAQLLCYAIGVNNLFRAWGYPVRNIQFRIVQPRPYHPQGRIRTWSIHSDRLPAYESWLRQQAALAMSDNPPVISGPHCFYCGAYYECKTSWRAASLSQDIAYQELNPGFTNAELTGAYKQMALAKEQIDNKLTVFEARIIEKIKRGENVPGYALEPGRGQIVWKYDEKTTISVGSSLGVNLQKPDPITPKQAENAGISAEIIKAMSKHQTGGLKLIADDKTLAAKAFRRK